MSLESNGNATGAEEERTFPEITLLLKLRAADQMARVCDDWVIRHVIDSRSALADARLDYGQPFLYEWSKTQHAPSVGPGNEAGAALLTEIAIKKLRQFCGTFDEQNGVHIFFRDWIISACQEATNSIRSELEQARKQLDRALVDMSKVSEKIEIANAAWDAIEHGLTYEGVKVGPEIINKAIRQATASLTLELEQAREDRDNAWNVVGDAAAKLSHAGFPTEEGDFGSRGQPITLDEQVGDIVKMVEQLRKALEKIERQCKSETAVDADTTVSRVNKIAVNALAPAASPRPEQTCIECGRGIGQLHKPKCSHTGRFLCEKEADVSADTAHPTEVQEN